VPVNKSLHCYFLSEMVKDASSIFFWGSTSWFSHTARGFNPSLLWHVDSFYVADLQSQRKCTHQSPRALYWRRLSPLIGGGRDAFASEAIDASRLGNVKGPNPRQPRAAISLRRTPRMGTTKRRICLTPPVTTVTVHTHTHTQRMANSRGLD